MSEVRRDRWSTALNPPKKAVNVPLVEHACAGCDTYGPRLYERGALCKQVETSLGRCTEEVYLIGRSIG